MEGAIKKYFWVLGVIVVMLCAVFTAKAVNHYVEAKFLPDDAKEKPAGARADARPPREQKSKAGEPLAKRNMFCHTCQPPEPVIDPGSPVSGDSVPLTALPLRLVATNLSTVEAESFATILNTSTNKQGSYWHQNEIPGAGKIMKIRGKFVDFENSATRRLERISLLENAPAVASAPEAPTEPVPGAEGGDKDELMAAVDEGVKKIDDTTYEIDRAVVDKVLANPTAVARGARIVPSIKNGKPNGFKLYAIRPSSVYAKIGLMNGDTIHSINGFDLTTPDKALEVYTKVREANSLSVTATRRGKPVTLNYTIK